MMLRTIRILLLILLSVCASAFSANMNVVGAGVSEVNGYYTNMGTHATLSDGVDYYQKGSIYLYRTDNGSSKIWILGLTLGDAGPADAYYGGAYVSDTPHGMTMEGPGFLGWAPMPSIAAASFVLYSK